MATARELITQGIVFEANAHGSLVSISGPVTPLEVARAEVLRRVDAMLTPPVLKVPRVGACSACADPLPPNQGGWCELCTIARRAALKRAHPEGRWW